MPTHAAILCRVSTEAQRDNTSLDEQRRILTELCERQGWTWEAFEEVESGGAGVANRPILAAILGRIAAGEFQRLVVLAQDRLSRAGVGELEQISAILAKIGARLVTQSGEFDPNNADHTLIQDINAVVAKRERAAIKERTIRGREARVKAGGFAGHAVPFGWRRIWNPDGTYRFEIEPDEAAVVRAIVDAYAEGVDGIHLVAERLGLPFAKVRYILTNPRYAGIESYRAGRDARRKTDRPPIVVPSAVWPAIITADQWAAVQAVKSRRRDEPRASGIGRAGPAKHPLSGIVVCRRCDRGMTMLQKAGRSYYHCGYRDCPRQDNARAEDCHRLTLAALPAILAHREAELLVRATDDGSAAELAGLRAAILRAEQSELDLWTERQAGRLDPAQWSRMNARLSDERAGIERQAAAIESRRRAHGPAPMTAGEAADIVANADHILSDWPTLRRLFAALLSRVEVAKVAYVTHECGRGRRPVIAIRAAVDHDGVRWEAPGVGPDCDI
jgi:DNA invertase Pin-like site-specific DNA recombinase